MPSTFEIKIVQKQATAAPVTTAIGTGSGATRTEFFIALASTVAPSPSDSGAVLQGPQGVPR